MIMWRVKFYDKEGLLLCWYTTANKEEATRYGEQYKNRCKHSSKDIARVEVEHYVTQG